MGLRGEVNHMKETMKVALARVTGRRVVEFSNTIIVGVNDHGSVY